MSATSCRSLQREVFLDSCQHWGELSLKAHVKIVSFEMFEKKMFVFFYLFLLAVSSMTEQLFVLKRAILIRRRKSFAIAFSRSVPWTAIPLKSNSGKLQNSQQPPTHHSWNDFTMQRRSKKNKIKRRIRSCWERLCNMEQWFSCFTWSLTSTWRLTSGCHHCWRKMPCVFT